MEQADFLKNILAARLAAAKRPEPAPPQVFIDFCSTAPELVLFRVTEIGLVPFEQLQLSKPQIKEPAPPAHMLMVIPPEINFANMVTEKSSLAASTILAGSR